jgi:hypothetical protein
MAGNSDGPNLTSVTAGVVAVLGVVGSLTAAGVIQRVLRNHGFAFVIALAFVLIGGLLWMLATSSGEKPIKLGRIRMTAGGIRIAAALFVGAGALGAMIITIITAGDAERPAISAAFDPETQRVKVTVTAGNLGSDDSIAIVVDGLRKVFEPSGGDRFRWIEHTVSQNYAGPDADGKVEMNLDIPVPPGAYDAVGVRAWSREQAKCSPPGSARKSETAVDEQSEESGAACAIVPIPAARPSVTAAWEDDGRKQEAVNVSASVPNARSQVLAVDITVRRSKEKVDRLQYSVSGPGSTGKAATTTRVVVPGDARRVCAEVRLQPIPAASRRKPTCPLPAATVHAADFDGAYAELRPTRDP